MLCGFFYRNAIESPSHVVACPLDARVCPDGTTLARTGISCEFPECPPPNISLPSFGIAFALPDGFRAWVSDVAPDDESVTYVQASSTDATTPVSRLVITRYPIDASSTVVATIEKTAVSAVSGKPVSATALTSTVIGTHRFTVAPIERFEGVIDTAYYVGRQHDVIRFDAIDVTVPRWNDPTLVESSLPAHAALLKLLQTLEGQE